MKGKFSLVLSICALIFALSSCKKESGQKKEVLRIYIQEEPMSLDPRIAGTRGPQVFLRQLFEGLFRLDKDGRPALSGAEKVNISDDGLHYIFHLRKTFWSNGDPVRAEDYEYAYKSILSPSFPSSFAYAFAAVKGAHEAKTGKIPLDEVGIKARDENTLEIELSHPAPYFLEFLANPIFSPVPKKIAEKNPNWAKNAGEDYVSNGPFTLKSWKHSSEFIMKKNSYYRDAENVKLKTINVAIIGDPQTALNMYEKGLLDMCGEPFGTLTLDAIPNFIKQGTLNTQKVGSVYWLEVNVEAPLLSSKKVRKALSLAINRKDLIAHLLQGGEEPASSILPPLFSLVKAPAPEYDLTEAKKLFDEGLQELNLTKKDLKPITITHWAEPKEKALMQAIGEQWKKTFGIEFELRNFDWGTYFKKRTAGEYDIAHLTWWSWYKDPSYNLEFMKFKTGGLNGTKWENDKYIALLERANQTLDQNLRNELLEEAEKLITDELPLIPVYYPTYKYLKVANLKGFFLTPLGQLELKTAYFE
jgi:oligopeptide transport system substrate-binding protein